MENSNQKPRLRHGSLFSGIGGFDLASSWMGWENVFQVENNSFCRKVLQKNFPNSKLYGDIRKFDGTPYRGRIDIIPGGFPCQPASQAGKRKGSSDDRWLWPEMLRVCREIEPIFIVGENVAGLLSLENGRAFDGILTDLADAWYETEQFVIPACAVGAWHRRDRVWILAYSERNYQRATGGSFRITGEGGSTLQAENKGREGETVFPHRLDALSRANPDSQRNGSEDRYQKTRRTKYEGKQGWLFEPEGMGDQPTLPPANSLSNAPGGSYRQNKRDDIREQEEQNQHQGSEMGSDPADDSGKREIESRLGGMVDGFSYWMDEPESAPRVVAKSEHRTSRLKTLGNAIVPQVAYALFQVLEQKVINNACGIR